MKKIIILIGIGLLFALLVIFFLFGFPWEHLIAKENAYAYVVEKYGLLPVELKAHFLLDYQVRIDVSCKDVPFDFHVTMSRRNVKNDFSDDYLEKLTEYNLKELIYKDMKLILGNDGDFLLSLDINFSSDKTSQYYYTETDVKNMTIFENINKQYTCYIWFNESQVSNFLIDYKKLYELLTIVSNKLQPNRIVFSYFNNEKCILEVNINSDAFKNINSSKDLIQYFEN